MKQLFLFRHGKAEEQQIRQADYDRKLTEVGEAEARTSALWLRTYCPHLDRIWASGSVRTTQTAQIIADVFRKTDITDFIPAIYQENDVQLIQRIAGTPEKYHSLVVVGHNPFLSLLAQYYSGDNTIQLRTASVAVLQFNTQNWYEVKPATIDNFKIYHP